MVQATPKKKQKKHRKKKVDATKQEETAKRIAAIEEKRRNVINIVRESLEKRLNDKLALRNARFQKEEQARQKAIRDSEKSRSEKMMLKIRDDLSTIVEAGIQCVYTSVILPEKIKYDGKSTMTIKGAKYRLRNNLHIVGWGQEAITMSSSFERVVGKQLKKGWMVVPRGSIFMMWSFPEAFPKLDSRISYVEGGMDGQPDEKSVEGTRKIIDYCKKLKKRDILIVMLSQEIDDLLCCPRETITLKDKLRLLTRLKNAKATTEEINFVRNKLSAIRGGDLARTAYPAKIIILITSDVSAEPLEFLAGGPCSYDPKDDRALAILFKYNLIGKVSQSVRDLIEETIPWEAAADEQLDDNKKYKFVQSYVVACNADAMECMAFTSYRYGLYPVKLNSICSGTVQEFAREYVKMASLMILAVEGKISKWEMYELMKDSTVCPLTDKKVREIFPVKEEWGLGLCLLLGGSINIDLSPNFGRGGPNQELALYFAIYWQLRTEQYPILRMYTVWFLGGSSYGKDGNTNAAGAFGYKNLGCDIQPEYKKIKDKYNSAHMKWFKLTEDFEEEHKIAAARKEVKELQQTKDMYAAILPEQVLKDNNSNLLFRSVNYGDELFRLKTGNYYTFTKVGELHVIRIVRFQCNCDSSCHGGEDRICNDKKCLVNRSLSEETPQETQFCCNVGISKKDQ